MTITEDIRGLWRALVPAARAMGRAQLEAGKPPAKTPAKHRADTSRRPYAPVGRTGARIYRPPSHHAR